MEVAYNLGDAAHFLRDRLEAVVSQEISNLSGSQALKLLNLERILWLLNE